MHFRFAISERGGGAIKAQHVFEHSPECRFEQIRWLRKHAGNIIRAAPLQLSTAMCVQQFDAERHVRRCHLYIEVFEHRDQVRVSPIIEHKKARIDWIVDAINSNVYGIRVAAERRVLLKQRDLMCAASMTRQ